MTRTQRILGVTGFCLLLSSWAGCYFNRQSVDMYDADGDGWEEDADCDDTNATVYPGADEICGDGLDNDCDGKLDFDDPECRVDGSGGNGAGGLGGLGGLGGMGGAGEGGSSQGGSSQGGSSQGGSSQGGSGQGGSGQGGSSQGGSSAGGAGTGGA